MADEARPVLSARGLTVAYGEAAPAVAGFDLDLHAGEVVGLTGPSGSGKSTAAYALLGLVRPPGRIVGGEVRLDGADLLGLPAPARRALRGERIGLIVQNPRGALHPMQAVGDQIGAVWAAHRKEEERAPAARRRERAVALLKRVGINDPERRAGAFAHQLSGGMAQRALIAMALSAEPQVLVADEPTSGLDVTVQAQFLDMMWRQAKATGTAMVLVTQEPGVLAHYCDRVAVMENGRIVEDGPTLAHFDRRTTASARRVRAPLEPRRDRPTVLEVEGLRKAFPVRGSKSVVQAAQDVTLTIAAGEALGLVGESGSGKTTVGRCILRLERPDGGVVRLEGEDLAGLSAQALRRSRAVMQMVPQDPHDSLDPRWTLGRTLAEPLALHTDMPAQARAERTARLLEQVGCAPETADRLPRELGAGVLQRAGVARALATDPRFVVLDEPTSVLTPGARTELVALLARLQDELGVAYLFISHDLTTVAALCHRVAVMYLGQIVETAATRALFERPRHPYSRALIAADLAPDPRARRVDRAVDDSLAGEIPSPIDLPKGCYLASRCPYVLERCRAEPQALVAVAPDRAVRCWRAVEDPAFPPAAPPSSPSPPPGSASDAFVTHAA